MKISAVTAIKYYPNIYNEQEESTGNTTPTQTINSTNLTTPDALYNRMQFTGSMKNKSLKDLLLYMENRVKPFLQEVNDSFGKTKDIAVNMKNEASNFTVPAIKFNPYEFKEVKRLRLDELDMNKQEYYYLLDKSNPQKKFYSTQETHDYAWNMYDYFWAPAFVREPYNAFLRMKKDTINGLENINLEKLFPGLANKKNEIYCTGIDARLSLRGFNRALAMYDKFYEVMSKGLNEINKLREIAEEAENGINYHRKYFSEIEKSASKANELYKTGMFIELDYDMLRSIPKRGQQVISRNARRFNDIAQKTQLDENETKQYDNILKKQKELIEDLWNKIEADKKAYFERQAKADAEFRKKAIEEETALKELYGDDIPF